MTTNSKNPNDEIIEALYDLRKNGGITDEVLYKKFVDLAFDSSSKDDLDSVIDFITRIPGSYWRDFFIDQAVEDEGFNIRSAKVSDFLILKGFIPIEAMGNVYGVDSLS